MRFILEKSKVKQIYLPKMFNYYFTFGSAAVKTACVPLHYFSGTAFTFKQSLMIERKTTTSG